MTAENRRILIIDDDPLVRASARMVLQRAGHVVDEANDGNVGIARAKLHRPDLILTDIVMPNKEGTETILEIRGTNSPVKIIAISGATHNLKVAKLMGADYTLHKPFSLEKLLDLVKAALK